MTPLEITVLSFYLILNLTCQKGFEVKAIDNKPEHDSNTFYQADHEYISYTGRIDFSNPLKPKFWAPGTYIEIKYFGTSCTVFLNDNNLWNEFHNYLEVVIDDTIQSRILIADKDNKIIFGEDLMLGHHTLLLCKDTESNIGYIELLGFEVQKLLPPDKKPQRKIEFIGNSITCGTGIDKSEIPCDSGLWYNQHNAYMSYGPVAARSLNAQWHLSSVSGIGIMHSCCNMNYEIIDVYKNIGFNQDSTPWDFEKYIPDVVTIALGQNDGIQDSISFCEAYIHFIDIIRKYYPETTIICLSSPMADKKLTKVLKKYLTGIVQYMNESGDNKIYKYFFTRSYNSGCEGHPDKKEHTLIARSLALFIKDIMNW